MGRAEIYLNSVRDRYQDLVVEHFNAKSILIALVAFLAVREVALIIYRLTFHPLAKYPGPFLAKISTLYEYYWDMIKDGQMVFHVNSALYPRYGKFVRIGPNRLRIQGLDAFYDMHYVGSSYAKDPTFYHLFGGIGQSMFMTFDAREHRVRRSYFNPVFSKKKILTIEPMVKGKVELLMRRFEEKGKAEGLVNVYDAYGAFTMDTVSEFIYDGSLDLLHTKDFTHELVEIFDTTVENFWFLKNHPFFSWLFPKIPLSVMSVLMPGASAWILLHELSDKQLKKLSKEKEAGVLQDPGKLTVMREMMRTLSPEIATPQLLNDDGTNLIAAGLHTVRWVLTTGSYHLARNNELQNKLLEELKTVWPDRKQIPAYGVLEQLPYLTGVIKESLRLGYGVIGALPRIVPPTGATVGGRHFPPGVILEVDIHSIHHNEDVFPDSFSFVPSRWLNLTNDERKMLEKNLVAFGNGSRMCIGINMAYLQLYLMFASLVRNFELELTEKHKKEGLQFTERWVVVARNDPLPVKLRVRDD